MKTALHDSVWMVLAAAAGGEKTLAPSAPGCSARHLSAGLPGISKQGLRCALETQHFSTSSYSLKMWDLLQLPFRGWGEADKPPPPHCSGFTGVRLATRAVFLHLREKSVFPSNMSSSAHT